MEIRLTPSLFIELEKDAKILGISVQRLIQNKLFEHYELIKKQPILPHSRRGQKIDRTKTYVKGGLDADS